MSRKSYLNWQNAEIVRPDVMTRVRILVPPLCMCEFMMALPSLLSTEKKVVIFNTKAKTTKTICRKRYFPKKIQTKNLDSIY